MRVTLALLAATIIFAGAGTAQACNEDGYKVLHSGDRIPTANCQSRLLGRVARAHKIRVSDSRIRKDPNAREYICDTVGGDPRIQVACALHDYYERRRRY